MVEKKCLIFEDNQTNFECANIRYRSENEVKVMH